MKKPHQKLLQRLQRHKEIPLFSAAEQMPNLTGQAARTSLVAAVQPSLPPAAVEPTQAAQTTAPLSRQPAAQKPSQPANTAVDQSTLNRETAPSPHPSSSTSQSTLPDTNSQQPTANGQPSTSSHPPTAPTGSNISDSNWNRLSRVMREHSAILAENGGSQPAVQKKGPSFLTPVQQKRSVQRREEIKANKDSMRRMMNPSEEGPKRAVQRRTALQVVSTSAPAGMDSRMLPPQKLAAPEPEIGSIQRAPANFNEVDSHIKAEIESGEMENSAQLKAENQLETEPPLAQPEAFSDDTSFDAVPNEAIPAEGSTGGDIATAQRAIDAAETASSEPDFDQTIADEKVDRVQRLVENVPAERPTDSPIEMIKPGRPRPTLRRKMVQKPVETSEEPAPPAQDSPPAFIPAPEGQAARQIDRPALSESRMIPTEIGDLPSDLWAMMDETPPVADAAAPDAQPAVHREIDASADGPLNMNNEGDTLFSESAPAEIETVAADQISSPKLGPVPHAQRALPVIKRETAPKADQSSSLSRVDVETPTPSVKATPSVDRAPLADDVPERSPERAEDNAIIGDRPAQSGSTDPEATGLPTRPAVQTQTARVVDEPETSSRPEVEASQPMADQAPDRESQPSQVSVQANASTPEMVASNEKPAHMAPVVVKPAVQRTAEPKVEAAERGLETATHRDLEGREAIEPLIQRDGLPQPDLPMSPIDTGLDAEPPVAESMQAKSIINDSAAVEEATANEAAIERAIAPAAPPADAVDREIDSSRPQNPNPPDRADSRPYQDPSLRSLESGPVIARLRTEADQPFGTEASKETQDEPEVAVDGPIPAEPAVTRMAQSNQTHSSEPKFTDAVPYENDSEYDQVNRTKMAQRQPLTNSAPPAILQRDDDDDDIGDDDPMDDSDIDQGDETEDEGGVMDQVEREIKRMREAEQERSANDGKDVRLYATEFEAQQELQTPQQVIAREGEKDSGFFLYGEREAFRKLERHSVPAERKDFFPPDFDEEEEMKEAEVDIERVSQAVYQRLRRRLSREWEQKRVRL
ncbi:MAG: hypothetical protein AAF633_01180 [Chloroflexota bacterium]